MNFAEFKKQKDLAKDITKTLREKPKSYDDPRKWVPKIIDKEKPTTFILRFLPQKDPTKQPIVRYLSHATKNAIGRWFFLDKCPSTFGLPCPACEHAGRLYDEAKAQGDPKHLKDEAKKFYKKKHYLVNVYIVKDPSVPENNGKVFIYDMPMTVYNKLLNKLAPEDPNDDPIQVNDLWEGRDFKLVIGQKAEYNNYDNAEFKDQNSPIADSEEKIEKIYNAIHDLSEWESKEGIESYDKIKDRFSKFLNSTNAVGSAEQRAASDANSGKSNAGSGKASTPASTPKAAAESRTPAATNTNADDIEFESLMGSSEETTETESDTGLDDAPWN